MSGTVHVYAWPDESLDGDARICDTHPRDWQREDGTGRAHRGVRVVYHPHYRRTEPGYDCVCCVCGEGNVVTSRAARETEE